MFRKVWPFIFSSFTVIFFALTSCMQTKTKVCLARVLQSEFYMAPMHWEWVKKKIQTLTYWGYLGYNLPPPPPSLFGTQYPLIHLGEKKHYESTNTIQWSSIGVYCTIRPSSLRSSIGLEWGLPYHDSSYKSNDLRILQEQSEFVETFITLYNR